MRYKKLRDLNDDKFKRLTGIKKATFEKMVKILQDEKRAKNKYKGGRNPSLSIEDTLLMALEYLREYRTYFHIGKSYGVSESSAFKSIRFVEDTLIKHKDFALPGRKELLKSENEYEVILIDATETPVERPKKNRKNIIQEKRKDTQ